MILPIKVYLFMSSAHSQTERAALRTALRARRRALSVGEQQVAARRLVSQLRDLPSIQQARRIALYWPVDGEIDARELARQPALSEQQFFLPVLPLAPDAPLRFARWQPGDVLVSNRYGIPEPQGEHFSAEEMDVLLLPLTGFDTAGNRLGMGGGYYDRALAFKHVTPDARPWLLGVAHACQQVESLPVEAWDVPLDGVVVG
jgi:5-formyltetrahydrofolate cyclo-ligase